METETVKEFADLFRGLEKAHGAVDLTKKDSNGKQGGDYKFVHESRTLTTYQDHLEGKSSIGIVPINEKNLCVFGAIDIDTYPLDHVEIIKRIEKLELPLVVCRSKSGGAHLYLFLKDWVRAEKLQNKLKEVRSELGLADNTEIFPKQIALVLERGDNGNFLNLPYFNHENGLRYAFKSDGSSLDIEGFLKKAQASAITEEELDSLVPKNLPDVDEKLRDGPPCLQALMRQGFPQGTRNNGLFNVGVYLRKAFPDEWETKILEYNQTVMDPPLDLKEVNIVADQLKKKDYQYKCADQPICNFCNKDICRSRKHGVGGGANTPSIANLRKYDSEPPLWFLDVNGKPVELDTEALQRQPKFQILCMEQINFMPRTITRQAWEALMNTLLVQMTQTEGAIITSSEDASIKGQFFHFVEEFCTHMQSAMDKEEILLRRPWTDEEEGRTYFRLIDLETFLRQQKFFEYKSNKIAQRLKDMGGQSDQMWLSKKKRPIRVWSIPAFLKIEPDFSSRFDADEVPF